MRTELKLLHSPPWWAAFSCDEAPLLGRLLSLKGFYPQTQRNHLTSNSLTKLTNSTHML